MFKKPVLKYGITVIVLALVCVSLYLFTSTTNGCREIIATTTIRVNDASFDPATTTISRCTSVTFLSEGANPHWPASDLHPTHGVYPEFDPQKPVIPGTSWSFTFDRVGRWKCHDHLRPLVRCIIDVAN